MSERAEWLARRRKHIGASDSAALMGLDEFRNATDVYWSKVREMPDTDSKSFEVGRRLESLICEWAADRLKVTIQRNVFHVRPGQEIFAATFDALVTGAAGEEPEALPRAAFEAKFSTQPEKWGDEGTDQVPERVLIQAQHQLFVGELQLVWVPALILTGRSAEFRLYSVRPHEELMRRIVERGTQFWHENVEANTPPDGINTPPLSLLRAMHRAPATIVELDDDAIDLWHHFEGLRELRKATEDKENEAYRAVVAALGEAEAGRLSDGRLITYLAQNSAPRCDTTRLRAVHPDIYAQFCSQGTHRVLRIKEPGKGKR